MVNTPLDRGLFVDELMFYSEILELPRFFGQNDFSIFFNEYHIDLGSIRFRKMLLLSECKTVSCIFMQYSAPKALRKGHKQNIGYTTYFQTHLLLQKYSNLTSFELQSDFYNP